MRLAHLTVAAALLPALAGGLHAQQRGEYAGWVDTSFAFAADGDVTLSQLGGDVIVRTWDRNEIRIVAYAELVQLETRFSSREVYVGLELPDRARQGKARTGDTQFEVTVPATARVSAKSISGDVTVEGIRGRVTAGSVSGDITVVGGRDKISVASVSGDVQVANATGRVSATSVNGDLVLADVEGDVTANTVSGDLMLQRVRARLITAKTVNGDIEFEGPIADDGRYELNTHSGDVLLHLPDGVNGVLSVSTFSGELDSEVPIVIGPGSRYGRGNTTMETKLGSGRGAWIAVKTFGGDVLIRRAR